MSSSHRSAKCIWPMQSRRSGRALLAALLLNVCIWAGPRISSAQTPPPSGDSSRAVRSDDQQQGGQAESGYIPGDRRALGLGLSPYAPQAPGVPGGLTTPFGAPAPNDEWTFGFRGYMSAALRVSLGSR